MKINHLTHFLILAFLSVLIMYSCKKDAVVYDGNSTRVKVNLNEAPFDKLSEYQFFIGEMKLQRPNLQVLPYAPASTLFTDYALKKRFVWMPSGTKATYTADNKILELPIGSALIKTFYYDNVLPDGNTVLMETRVMIRKSSGWIFAEYIWNEEQTEAYLNMDGSFKNISWSQNGTVKSSNYRFPSATECLVCHKKNNQPIPIGIKPQNLNIAYNYANGSSNQLQKWIAVGYLENNIPSNILSTVDYHDETESINDRLRSYLDINCAHCHAEGSHCDYRPMRLAFSETAMPINLGLCVQPDEFINSSLTNIITPGNKDKSMMYFRLNSTLQNQRMPLLGRTIVHEEGVQLLEDWIAWKTTCN